MIELINLTQALSIKELKELGAVLETYQGQAGKNLTRCYGMGKDARIIFSFSH